MTEYLDGPANTGPSFLAVQMTRDATFTGLSASLSGSPTTMERLVRRVGQLTQRETDAHLLHQVGSPHLSRPGRPSPAPLAVKPIELMQFAEILLRRGLLKPHQLEQVQASHGDDRNLLEAASDLGFLNPAEALQAIGEEVGVDYLDLNSVEVDLSLLKQFPLRLIHRVGLFPISRENGQITVATSDPFDLYPLDEVGAATGLSVHPVLAERKEIGPAIDSFIFDLFGGGIQRCANGA